jgi:hypothetical protein
VTIDGVWIGNWIELPLTTLNLALSLVHILCNSLQHPLVFSVSYIFTSPLETFPTADVPFPLGSRNVPVHEQQKFMAYCQTFHIQNWLSLPHSRSCLFTTKLLPIETFRLQFCGSGSIKSTVQLSYVTRIIHKTHFLSSSIIASMAVEAIA